MPNSRFQKLLSHLKLWHLIDDFINHSDTRTLRDIFNDLPNFPSIPSFPEQQNLDGRKSNVSIFEIKKKVQSSHIQCAENFWLPSRIYLYLTYLYCKCNSCQILTLWTVKEQRQVEIHKIYYIEINIRTRNFIYRVLYRVKI